MKKNVVPKYPKYLQYEGNGIQYIFCVDENLDVNSICATFWNR